MKLQPNNWAVHFIHFSRISKYAKISHIKVDDSTPRALPRLEEQAAKSSSLS